MSAHVVLAGVFLGLALLQPEGINAQAAAGPVPMFTLNVDAGTVPLLVTTTNGSTGADHFSWEWGDGRTSDAPEPSHVYVRPGLLIVALTACAGDECATATRTLNVLGRDSIDGGLLRNETPVYGSINAPGDTDIWQFEAPPGSLITLELEPDVGSPVDPVLRLFGPDGSLIAFNDDDGPSPTARIRSLELTTGAYIQSFRDRSNACSSCGQRGGWASVG